jgi:hypothetical protein
MIDKCANPLCDERLIYLRSGVLYAVETYGSLGTPKGTHFYWMCQECSSEYKLHFRDRGNPEVVPINMPIVPDPSDLQSCKVRCIQVTSPPQKGFKSVVSSRRAPLLEMPISPMDRDQREKNRLPKRSNEPVSEFAAAI